MKKLYFLLINGLLVTQLSAQNCEINVSASLNTIACGDCVTLTAFGSNTALSVLNEDFNTGGFGPGWSGTPGAVNFSNPCSGGGVDGTPHAWMDNNTDVPRELISAPYDFSTATAGVTVCFDMLFSEQGDAAPCEGPDEADEGVYLEYSTDGGTTWTTINYFDPNGGNDPQLTNWNNYCFDLPPAALTSNTLIRWYQDDGSGQDFDHWGIDNVQIFVNDITSEVTWIADAAVGFPSYSYGIGVGGGDLPTQVCPSTTTTYTAQIETGTGDVCTESITIVVNPVVITSSISASPLTICPSAGECSDIEVEVEIIVEPAESKTFANIQPFAYGNGIFGSGSETVNINIQDLNMPVVSPGSISEICIDYLTFEPSALFGAEDGVEPLEISITCPSGETIILVHEDDAPEGDDGGFFGSADPSYYQDVCFVPVSANLITNIGDGSAAALPITGTYQSAEPFTDLEGCTSNGVWQLGLDNSTFFGGDGLLTGWSITFEDEPLYGTPNFTWTPSAGLSDATSLTPEACTPGTYTIDIDNGIPGCGTAQETITINGATGGDATFTTTDYCAGAANNATITGDTGGTFTFNPAVADGASIDAATGEITNGVGGTTYTIEYTSPGACGDVTTETVTVTAPESTTVNIDACENSDVTYPDGTVETIIASTSHISNLTTINGCDSIVTTNVTLTNITSTETVTSCENTTYTYPDGFSETINANSSHISTLTAISGCDSTVTTNVTMLPILSSTEDFDICQNVNYTYPDGVVETILTDVSHVSNLTSIDGCDSLITTNITLIPVQNTSENISTCENSSVTYPDGTSETVNTNTVHISNLTAINGCDSTVTTNVTMFPNYDLTENFTLCSGEDYTYPDGTVHVNLTANESYTSNFTSINGCDSIITTTVNVNALPNITANSPAPICEGETVTLSGNGGLSYIWDNGVINNTPFEPLATTTYTIIGTDGNGCTNTTTANVTVHPNPIIDFTATPQIGCAPLEVEFLNATTNSINCLWDYGNGTSSTACGNTQITYNNAGIYSVTLTVSNTAGCTSTHTEIDYIEVQEQPVADFSVDNSYISIENTEVEFTNLSLYSTFYEWNFGDEFGGSNEENPLHVFPATGNTIYTVELIASNDIGCSDTTTAQIHVNDVIIYYVPNAFTPDGDEFNQIFQPVFTSGFDIYDYHLIIFNRWGEVMFESYNSEFGWDGTYSNGELVPDGVYTWKINFKESMSDKKHQEIGHVTILK